MINYREYRDLEPNYYAFEITFTDRRAPRGFPQTMYFKNLNALFSVFTKDDIGVTLNTFYQNYSRTLFEQPYQRNGVRITKVPIYDVVLRRVKVNQSF
jgi:hypothetical protein